MREWLVKLTPSLVISGGARGADAIAADAAVERGISTMIFPADWQRYGRSAGAIRNQRMLDEGRPTDVLAFSTKYPALTAGTRDMVARARRAGLPVIVVGPEGEWGGVG